MTVMSIKVGGSKNQKAIFWDKLVNNIVAEIVYFCFGVISLVGLVEILLYYFYPTTLTNNEIYLGLSFFCLDAFLVLSALRSFVNVSLKKPQKGILNIAKQAVTTGRGVNLFDALSFDLAKSLAPLLSQKKTEEISLTEISQAVFNTNDINFVVLRLGISPESVVQSVEKNPGLLPQILSQSIDFAILNNHDCVWPVDALLALNNSSSQLKRFWSDFGLDDADFANITAWQTAVKMEIDKKAGVFNPANLKKNGGVGRDWAFGYTNLLRQYSVNITEAIESGGLGLQIIGRENEIRQINEALSKQSGGNVLLVGDAGVGKHTTVLGFAKKMLEGESVAGLSHHYVFQIDTEALLSGATTEGEIVGRVSSILSEASYAGNVIALIENIDHLFSAEGVGTADLTAVLMPYLDSNAIKIIGTCEVEPYNQYIMTNSQLSNHFVRISIDEPEQKNLVKILEDTAPFIEVKTGSIITYEAIKSAIAKANKYLVNATEPERSIGLLEGASLKATSERGKTLVLDKDIDEYLSEKMKLPSKEAGEEEKERLLKLEDIMAKDVIGQSEAVKALADAMRRNRAQISDSSKPIGSFLFLGPTGVGKTATAKALAKAYFGDKSNMIRFDMSEYQNKSDIHRLIGTKTETGNLTKAVAENPFSLLLFDEIEKANPDILNLFLQILDEGILTDGRDQKVVFANTIIIATSNAGSDLIRHAIDNGSDYAEVKKQLNDYVISQNIFRPEFLNRFSEIVAFSPLSKETIHKIAGLLFAELAHSVLDKRGVVLEIDPVALETLANLGFDPKMGARPMERVMAEKIENLIAKKVLGNELTRGDKFVITNEMIV